MDFINNFTKETKPEDVSERIHQNRVNQKREIIKTAFNIFAKKGYYKTTLEDIASEMGITRAALYRYFSSKNELLFNCYKVVFDYWLEKLEQPKSIQDPQTRLTKMLEAHILLFLEDFPFSIPTLSSDESSPPEYKDQIINFKKAIVEPYLLCLREWRIKNPDQLKSIDDKIIINTLFSTANSVPLWWDSKSDPKLVVKQVVSILMDGIQKNH
ncbi:TetR/AcrR family transcriptional regulator [Neobacillus sp.]|uniref:TetR/AcrR family transcriptional regulator n=1 Tax=Neobacillus sp. TaxID=2675273 RepID=UPI00289EAA82|nr:TetR/AcrR family transcriptional regulator [Neobacillus sp.]